MLGILGDTCLLLALTMAAVQALAPLLARWRKDARFLALSLPAMTVQLLALVAAFCFLTTAYITSDFSLITVALNSHTAKPLIYKITATWGNHEGSMLLWLLVLALFGWAAARRSPLLRIPMLAAQGLLATGLLLFVFFTSNPFDLIHPPMPEGQGFNPILQDIGLAIHPPMLYLGYVGFGIVFAYAAAGMAAGAINTTWAKTVHPWITLSWAFLTLGIGLGSWWAYRELGWGGWWFWDPVENVSLLPWLAGTALMHANRTLMTTGRHAQWTVSLAILTFAMSLIGTFIVRSGLLVSVHSFASDPGRGLFILIYLTLAVGAALWLFMRYSPAPPPAAVRPGVVSRDGFIVLGNVFFVAATLTILIAILYPLVLQFAGQPSISVGPPYFNQTVLPLMAPTLLLAGSAPLLAWQPTSWRKLLRRLLPVAGVSALVAILCLALLAREALLTAGGMALSAWLIAGVIYAIRRQSAPLSRRAWAMALGHIGFAVFVLSMTLESLHRQTHEAVLSPGDSARMGEYTLTFDEQILNRRDNFAYRQARVSLTHDTEDATRTLTPELRFYPVRDMHTTEAAIATHWWGDVYVVSALQPEADRLAFTLHVNPGQQGLWLGFLLAGAGGLLAGSRRYHQRPEKEL